MTTNHTKCSVKGCNEPASFRAYRYEAHEFYGQWHAKCEPDSRTPFLCTRHLVLNEIELSSPSSFPYTSRHGFAKTVYRLLPGAADWRAREIDATLIVPREPSAPSRATGIDLDRDTFGLGLRSGDVDHILDDLGISTVWCLDHHHSTYAETPFIAAPPGHELCVQCTRKVRRKDPQVALRPLVLLPEEAYQPMLTPQSEQ
jgi:hypothetical protein